MPNTLSLLNKDFEAIREGMVNDIPNKTDRWTDFNESDIGMTLLELWAGIGETILFYLDMSVLESFLGTVRQRKNLMNLVKLIGYKLEHVVSSTSIVEISLASAATARVEIPKYTRMSAGSDIQFVTTTSATIPVGDSSVLVGVRQGVLTTYRAKTTGGADQRYRLEDTEVDVLSIEVVVNNIIWTQVDNFVNSQAGDRHYVVEVDSKDNVDIVFGDGYTGYAPPESTIEENVKIRYLVSKGREGNIGSNTITVLLDTIYDTHNPRQIVSASVTNIQAATGGNDQETIEHAKKQAPAELAALFRAMTKGDYIALCEGYPGIGKANAWGEQDESPPDYNLYNWVLLAISPEGITREDILAGTAGVSDELKDDILTFLESRKCITTRLKIVETVYIPVDISLEIYYTPGYLAAPVKADVEDAIVDFLAIDNVSFGKEIRKSNVIRVADSVEGVDYVNVTKLKTTSQSSDVNEVITVNRNEIPYLRTLVLSTSRAVDSPTRAGLYPCPPQPPAPQPD